MSSLTVFVDDNDPNIKYSDGWVLQTFSAANATGLAPSPLYGTLHELNSTQLISSNISYTFNGTEIQAFFGPGMTSGQITQCMIDSQPQQVTTGIAFSAACQSNQTLQDGIHELFIEVTQGDLDNTISLDYLEYSPSKGLFLAEDLLYISSDPSIKMTIDPTELEFFQGLQSLDFDFIGYSLGLYGVFTVPPGQSTQIPSAASYSIDGGPSINFTITNSATVANPFVFHQIVVQTPRYPLGQHHFRLDFLGANDTVPLVFDVIILQNNTHSVNLETIPAISSTITHASTISSTSSARPSAVPPQATTHAQTRKPDHMSLIVGLAVIATILTLVAALGFLLHRRRRNRILLSEQAYSPTIFPFNQAQRYHNEYVKRTQGEEETERVVHPDSSDRSQADIPTQNLRRVTVTDALFVALKGLFNRSRMNHVIPPEHTHSTTIVPYTQPRLHQSEYIKGAPRSINDEEWNSRADSWDGSTTIVSARSSQQIPGNSVMDNRDR